MVTEAQMKLEEFRAKKQALNTQPSAQQPQMTEAQMMLQKARASKQPVQESQPQQKVEGSILNPVANALGFGWTDEALAGILAGYGALSGDIPKNQVGEAYNSIRQGIEDERKAYAESDPIKSVGAEIVTASIVGLPKILEALATKGLIGAGAVAGVEGFIYGAGEGGEGFEKGESLGIPFSEAQAPIDISGRVTGAMQTGALAVPFGVGGAKVAQGVGNVISNKAAINKMVRQGAEAPETAPYTLKKPSQKQVVEPVQTGDVVQDTLTNIPQRPQGFVDTVSELSPFKPSVVRSQAADKALYQEVSESTINNIREANNATRAAMADATKIHYAKTRGLTKTDPYTVVGNEFNKRLNVVKNQHQKALTQQSKARKEVLEKVSGEQLAPSVDKIAKDFVTSLESKRVRIGEDGMLDFSMVGDTSPLKKASNRAALNKTWNQFRKARTAEDLHILRSDVDNMIRFEKGGVTGGVDDATNAILKDMRGSIRDSLIELSPEYAEANRILSQNFEALDSLSSAMPRLNKKYDFNDPKELDAAINHMGQQLRKLDSNYANADELSMAVDMFDNLSKEYGASFPVDLKRLNTHLAEIKLRLGEGKAGAFQSKVESGVRRGMTSPDGVKIPTNTKEVLQITKEALRPVKGISDKDAYESIIEYIEEMNKRTKP